MTELAHRHSDWLWGNAGAPSTRSGGGATIGRRVGAEAGVVVETALGVPLIADCFVVAERVQVTVDVSCSPATA